VDRTDRERNILLPKEKNKKKGEKRKRTNVKGLRANQIFFSFKRTICVLCLFLRK